MATFAVPQFGSFFEETFLNEEPRAAYSRYLEPHRGTPLESYGNQQFNKYYSRFLSDLARDPSKSFLDALGGYDLEREYRSSSPTQRGENPSAYVGRVKAVGL